MYVKALAVILLALVGLFFYITTIEQVSTSHSPTHETIDSDKSHQQTPTIESLNDKASDIEPQQSKAENESTARFYLASLTCRAEIKKIFAEYPFNGELFRQLIELSRERFPFTEGKDLTYPRVAKNLILSSAEFSYVNDALNRNSPDFTSPEFVIETVLRDESYAPDSNAFLEALKNNQFSLAESLLEDLVAQAPDKILIVPGASLPLLTISLLTQSNKSDIQAESQGIKATIDVFDAVGYEFHFAELLGVHHSLFQTSADSLEYLTQKYKGNLSTVFDQRHEKSSNLVLDALKVANLKLAAFWIKKGVNPFSNYKTLYGLQWILPVPTTNESSQTTQAFRTLLNAGVITTRPDKKFEEKLNAWLPQSESSTYYEKHQRVSILSAEQDKRLQTELAELAQALMLEHTGGNVDLPAGCEDELIAKLRAFLAQIAERSQNQAQKDRFDELHEQAVVIYREYSKELIDADLAIQQLSLLDEYRAKQKLSLIENSASKTISLGYPLALQDGSAPEQLPDKSVLESIKSAVMSGDYEKALALANSLDPYYQQRVHSSIFYSALSKPASTEVYRLLLNDVEMRPQLIISAALRSNDMQFLENIANAGFDINSRDQLHRSLLTLAIEKNHKTGLRKLIELGVDVEQPTVGLDALDMALAEIIKGHKDFYFVQKLLMANKRIEDSHRQLLSDLLKVYPEPTQRVIDKYGIVM